jgi:hypothetical protein
MPTTKTQTTDTLIYAVSTQFNALIDKYGSSVTLKSVTLPDPNSSNGTAAETYVDSTIKAVFPEGKTFISLIQDTIVISADRIAYLKSDQPIKKRDIIVYGGENYEVDDIFMETYLGAIPFKKVTLKRQ